MTAEITEPVGSRSSVIAFAIMTVVCLFGVFSPGAPLQTSHGIICLLTGAAMLLLPPRVAVPWQWWLMAALFLLLCSLAFLPREFFSTPSWRQTVEGLGVSTGSFVTAHPRQTLEFLAGVGITVVVALYLLGHRVSERSQRGLVLFFALGVDLYAAFCICVQEQDWQLPWDPEPSFGLFPNRNNTGTLLVMGVVAGIATLLHAARRRQGSLAAAAAVAVAVSAWAVLAYCGSRAGVLALVIGLGVWVAGLGHAVISRKVGIALILFVTAATAVFWFSKSAVKSRLTETVEQIVREDPLEKGTAEGEAGHSVTKENDTPLDFRVHVYKDTVKMLVGEPWTGVGLGMFRYVFPVYRKASGSSSIALHPESDWLMMGSEAGLLATLMLAGLVVVVMAAAIHQARRRRGWTLRWGCLVAAMVVPLYGLWDVPGHRVGLAWSSLLLVALSFRIPEETTGTVGSRRRFGVLSRAFFRLAGAAVMLAGGFLVRAEWWGGRSSALAAPDRLADQARALYAEDQARIKNLSPAELSALPEATADATLKSAIALVEQALAVTPLDPNLHYLRGALALHFDEMDATVEQSFAVQRLLDPFRVEVPLWQAQGWAQVEPSRTATLWGDALQRAAGLEARSRAPETTRRYAWFQIMTQVMAQPTGQDELARRALAVAAADSDLVLGWAQQAPPALLDEMMPSLLTADPALESRRELFQVWLARGDKTKATAFGDTRPELK